MAGLADDGVDICNRSNYQPNLAQSAGNYEEENGVWFPLAQQTFREWTVQEQEHTAGKEGVWL